MTATDLFVEAFVDETLGNSAYLVGSHAGRRAVLIDPLRDVDRYLSAAERLGVRVTHVLDTHLHADFLSGARELAAQVGAQIAASAGAHLAFDHLPLPWPADQPSAVYCAVGARSTAGISARRRRGFTHLYLVEAGSMPGRRRGIQR